MKTIKKCKLYKTNCIDCNLPKNNIRQNAKQIMQVGPPGNCSGCNENDCGDCDFYDNCEVRDK